MEMVPGYFDTSELACAGLCGRTAQFATFATLDNWRVVYPLCEFCLPKWEAWKAKMERSSFFVLDSQATAAPVEQGQTDLKPPE